MTSDHSPAEAQMRVAAHFRSIINLEVILADDAANVFILINEQATLVELSSHSSLQHGQCKAVCHNRYCQCQGLDIDRASRHLRGRCG